MRYLLDVNALLALIVTDHIFNVRTSAWVRELVHRDSADLATCAITEIGFVRILSLPSTYGRSVLEAQTALRRAKASTSYQFSFIPDTLPADDLPSWTIRSAQVTDGHLLQLAKAHDCTLATLDHGIPGAFLIPA